MTVAENPQLNKSAGKKKQRAACSIHSETLGHVSEATKATGQKVKIHQKTIVGNVIR